MDIIQWLTLNEKWITVCISLLSLLISSILTFLIIHQTRKLNKQQMLIEEDLNDRQIEMQKKQIRIDSYPYKREIYCYVFSVLELCHQLQDLLESVDLQTKDPAQLLEFFNILREQYVPDSKRALWSMREAEYILPRDISAIVIEIRKNYDSMCAHFITPATITKVLTPLEMEVQINEIKRFNINKAIDCCNEIVKYTSFIEDRMPKELDISALSK